MAIQFDKIKLVIWDLDDTFWSGTLSEGDIVSIPNHIELIKQLTDHGIVNMICSKNDKEPAEAKLRELGIGDYFVFNSINWQPKGQRIADSIKTMGLRPINCLFIDDNIQNLEEARYSAEGLMIAEPSEIDALENYIKCIPTTDSKHKRLSQYKILEAKTKASTEFSDNTEFLFSSNIQVEICYDCLTEIDRVAELVLRTNQLNFTKRRHNKEELIHLINDPSCTTGYVKVKDRFGDYGITGFFAVKNRKCIHFLFSCRTIGQGIEQYVYSAIGYPEIEIIQPVISQIDKTEAPLWINQKTGQEKQIAKRKNVKILFKGACDLDQMAMYLNSDDIICEFTYIGKSRHNTIEFHNHSVNYLQFPFLDQRQRNELLKYPFSDEEMFDTQLYSPDVALIVVSTMIEANLGIYRRKTDNYEIALLESKHPLTNPENWQKYINHEIFDSDNEFSLDFLEKFSNEFEFIGTLTPEQVLDNAKRLLDKANPSTKVCFILGPETAFEKETKIAYKNRHHQYAAINKLFREYAANEPRMLLLDTNEFVKEQRDFTDNINHWQRKVYYSMAGKINKYISEITGTKSYRKGLMFLYFTKFKYWLVESGFLESSLWQFIRKYRDKLKSYR